MRATGLGRPVAQPDDTLENIREALYFGTPQHAEIRTNLDVSYQWGGEVADEINTRLMFDSFETKEAMEAWLVDVIGLQLSQIHY